MKNSSFYDEISVFYDEMINFDNSLTERTDFFKTFLASKNISTAADVGCGSGLDSIALASLGCQVTGFDSSPVMIKKAGENASGKSANIKFLCCPAAGIPPEFDTHFDIVVSLGNSIANIPPASIRQTLSRFMDILKPGGILLLQILNYDKILKEKRVIINVKNKENNLIVRFYDYTEDYIVFNILRTNSLKPEKGKIYKTILYPYTSKSLLTSLTDAGFGDINIFGSLGFDEWDEDVSNDIIISAMRQ